MELEPENLTVLRVAAMVAGSKGTTAEAEELSRRLAALDPLQANVYTSLAMRCQESGRFGEAIDLARKAIALGGGFGAQSTLAASLAELGQWEEALTAAKQESIEGLSLYAQADVFLKMDRPEEASRILERLVERHSHEASSQIAELMAGLGRFDEAFDWIERAIRELDGGLMESLLVQRYFLPMHADRRWTALLKRLHFED